MKRIKKMVLKVYGGLDWFLVFLGGFRVYGGFGWF